jgi:hypothetical protein
LGAGLLVVSDTLIGIGLTEIADLPGRSAMVMATYLAGLILVVSGWIARPGGLEGMPPFEGGLTAG